MNVLEVTLGPAVQTFLAHQMRHAPMTHGMTEVSEAKPDKHPFQRGAP
jgi:hypothetical protein